MQSKINSFYKPPSSTSNECSNSPPHFCNNENDELATWEKSHHIFVNTYTRRASNFEGIDRKKESSDEKSENPISENRFSREESGSGGRNLNKKRSYAQFHLELGVQLADSSTLVGMEPMKSPIPFFIGISLLGFNSRDGEMRGLFICPMVNVRNKVQEVVKMMETELGEGWIFHKLCKVYLFVSSQRIAGCVVAEAIKEAFEVLWCSVGERHGATAKKARPNSQREVMKRAPSEVSYKSRNGAILCKREGVGGVCGIRAIWVTPSNRRKGVATQLLEAVRKSFRMGYVIERSEVAFSQPSSDGQALASNYIGTTSFLVYKTGNLCR
ncbi:CHROMOSOME TRANSMISSION FIDELITY 7 [Hibiscus trionum]|uniref:CHROMOSOME TRANSMISSION FIDELITY 7 n=1 Tax=Hibiscus trionum TaxID=183268 RepID=A0A9W7M5J1_HIBTR|nr:CHROMOSOME TRANSMISSION FIDELITY 7 [Hibiscus trionum]